GHHRDRRARGARAGPPDPSRHPAGVETAVAGVARCRGRRRIWCVPRESGSGADGSAGARSGVRRRRRRGAFDAGGCGRVPVVRMATGRCRVIDLRMNERAWSIADSCVARLDELRIGVHTLANGARVIDAGVDAVGGLGAGLALAELCMGGLGHVSLASLPIDGQMWPGVQVWTDHPAECCMASQYAGWAIDPAGYFAMGSGPLRAKARVEKELFTKLGYAEHGARGVLVLEARALPTADVAEWIAKKAGIQADALTLA